MVEGCSSEHPFFVVGGYGESGFWWVLIGSNGYFFCKVYPLPTRTQKNSPEPTKKVEATEVTST